jgi:ComF family protein
MVSYLLRIEFNILSYDLTTAVPMHPYKLKQRGYNQAELLAKSLANYFKIPFRGDIIYKKNNRLPQVNLDRKAREDNIKGSFFVSENLRGKKIILVDDIFTTGCTIKECASELKKKGAENITAITLAKTFVE